MARIFTINFQFRGSEHAAIVSTWKENARDDFFQATLYDETLLRLVPNGIVRFSSREDAALQTDTACADLVHCLKKAVTRYLQKLPFNNHDHAV